MMIIIPLMIVWYIFKNNRSNSELRISTIGTFGNNFSYKSVVRHLVFAFRLLGIALLITVLARPQSSSSWKNISTKGINIIISMDISASMLARDLEPNRLEASKEVAKEFIDKRPNDRIGLVIFSGESFTQCPLTTDHAVIKNMFSGIKTGMIADGTAIGNGLATAVSRIDTNARSNVIILLTDGVNNQGAIAPLTAAEIAKTYKARVYTIGLGSTGKALSPVALLPNGEFQFDYVDVKIDEEILGKIAEMTGGKYFRATDTEKLKDVYNEIDTLEKNIIEEKNFTNREERFFPFALAAAILFLLEFILRNTVLKSLT